MHIPQARISLSSVGSDTEPVHMGSIEPHVDLVGVSSSSSGISDDEEPVVCNEDSVSSTGGSDGEEEDDDSLMATPMCGDADDTLPVPAGCTCGAQGGCAGGRPEVRPCKKGAKVYCCSSTACSRALAERVKVAALGTKQIHASSTTGTPWIHARRLGAIKEQNAVFLRWCRSWIEEVYGADASEFRSPRTEPHIVKYDHRAALGKAKAKFRGIGVHQDGSFVTCIMTLSAPDEYSGGGTYFPHLSETVRLGMGEVLMFQGQQGPYSAPHRAQPISDGRRVLYIAFFKLRKRKAGRSRKTNRHGGA